MKLVKEEVEIKNFNKPVYNPAQEKKDKGADEESKEEKEEKDENA